ncbi:TPA: hypothetical protein EYN98_09930 [Candidatus Poribacteria bacterium]|nr:hypothetical protein [Candidatus Poribacteria bacterium]HIO49932.1 hypothetical protein [Candidatus Poribacteria bacterium]
MINKPDSLSGVDKAYQTILSRLQSILVQWRLLTFSQNFLRWLSVIIISFSIALLIDQMIPLPRLMRMALVITVSGICIGFGYRHLVCSLFRKLGYYRVSAYVESSHPEIENCISSAVQLRPEIERNQFGYSVAFIEKLIWQAHQSLSQIDLKRVFQSELSLHKKNAILTLFAVLLLVITTWIFPNSIRDFALVFEEIPKNPIDVVVVQISDVQPGNILIESGSDVGFSAKVTGTFGASVDIFYRSKNGTWHDINMLRTINEIAYHRDIKNVTQSLEYYIASKGTRSDTFQVGVRREPALTRFQLKLNFPVYTGLSPELLEENFGDVNTLIGTRVGFEGNGSKPIVQAKLVFGESDPVLLKVIDGTCMTGDFIIQESEEYYLELVDADGVTNSDPTRYTINAIEDQAPRIEILIPGKDVVLDDSMMVSLKTSAVDDYGVKLVQIVYRVEGQDRGEPSIPVKDLNPSLSSVITEFSWDVDLLHLFPGDVVSYHAEAIDVIGRVGKSVTFTIRFPSLAEIFDEIESKQEASVQGLEAIFEQQSETEAAVEGLIDKIKKSQELTVKDEKLIEQFIENQKQIERSVKDRIEEVKELTNQIENQQLLNQETVEKYQELQQLMDQALSDEHKEILEKLSEALREQQLLNQERRLEEANVSQEQFVQQLDRLTSLYKQLILQQKLEAAVKQADELVQRQKQISEQIDQMTNRQISEEGKNLAVREEKVKYGLSELQMKLDQVGSEMSEQPSLKRIGDEVQRLSQFSKDQKIAEQITQTSSQLRQFQLSEARQSSQKAMQGLTELHQGLDNAMEFMEGANADQMLAEIRVAVRTGLYLSRTHEETADATKDILRTGRGDYIDGEVLQLQNLAASEIHIAQGIDLLASQLWELGKQQMGINPQIVWRLNGASDQLTRSAKALEDRKPSLATPIQKQGLASLNQVISDLLETMDQMNQQMSMSSSGLDQMMEQLQQLSENQRNLNEFAQQLHQQMRRQGQTPNMQQTLERLAQEQQMIREATERLAELMGNLSEVLGDLRPVSEEMQRVESELQRGNLDQEVIDKQKEILTRLLDSSKSLWKKEVSRKRKGETAKSNRVNKSLPDLDSRLLQVIQQMQLGMRSGQVTEIPLQYRDQIQKYFSALSQQVKR